MEGEIKVIEGIYPVTRAEAVYYNDSMTVKDKIASISEGNGGTSKLEGKKWTVIGDSRSITNGGKSYSEIISARTGAILNNKAVSGGTIMNSIHYPGVYRIGSNAVNNCATHNDIITIAGGVNDFQFERNNLGTPDDVGYDTSTLGAYNQMLIDLITAYPNARIFILLPIKIGTDATHGGFVEWVDGIKQVASKYAIPTLDLYRNCGFTSEIQAQKELYINDGLHPTDLGHQRLANIIQNWIESLL